MKSDAARNGGASNTGTGYLPFTKNHLSYGATLGYCFSIRKTDRKE